MKTLVSGRLRIAICDDDNQFLLSFLQEVKEYEQLANIVFDIQTFGSGEELIEASKYAQSWDVVFLDIEMKDKDGVQTARILRSLSMKFILVFVTSYTKYSLAGYSVGAIRYLIKGFTKYDLYECLDFIIDTFITHNTDLLLKTSEGILTVNVQNLLYVASKDHKLEYHLSEPIRGKTKYTAYGKLDTFQSELPIGLFLRIHKSFLVNIRKIVLMQPYKVVTQTGNELPIPKAQYGQVKKDYMLFQSKV